MATLLAVFVAAGLMAGTPRPQPGSAANECAGLCASRPPEPKPDGAALAHAAGSNVVECAKSPDAPSPCLIFFDSDGAGFSLNNWAESLTGKATGLYLKNGHVLAVVRQRCDETRAAFRSIKAKMAAVALFREHFPDLPSKIEKLPMRTLIEDDSCDGKEHIAIFDVKLDDLRTIEKRKTAETMDVIKKRSCDENG